MSLKKHMQLGTILSVFTLVGVLFAHLALTDIGHNNEPNLAAEWAVVQLFFGLLVVTLITDLWLIRRAYRQV